MSDWNEADHPREPAGSPEGGQFASGGGGGGSRARIERSGDLRGDLDQVDSPHQIGDLLRQYQAEPVKFGAGAEVDPVWDVGDQVVEWDGTSDYVSVSDKARWVSEIREPRDYYPNYEEEFNRDFWGGTREVYHATTEDHLASILAEGLEPRSRTRGISNRGVGPAVFTTLDLDEASDGSYGDVVLAIDLAAMKRDGLTPYAAQEEDVVDGELRGAIANAIGADDYQYEWEQGMSPHTVVLHGAIPPKYLRVVTAGQGRQARESRAGKWDVVLAEADADECTWRTINGNPVCIRGGHGEHGDEPVGRVKTDAGGIIWSFPRGGAWSATRLGTLLLDDLPDDDDLEAQKRALGKLARGAPAGTTVVYRVGSDKPLDNRNAGDAAGVLHFLWQRRDSDSMMEQPTGDRIVAWAVTLRATPTKDYTPYVGGRLSGLTRPAGQRYEHVAHIYDALPTVHQQRAFLRELEAAVDPATWKAITIRGTTGMVTTLKQAPQTARAALEPIIERWRERVARMKALTEPRAASDPFERDLAETDDEDCHWVTLKSGARVCIGGARPAGQPHPPHAKPRPVAPVPRGTTTVVREKPLQVTTTAPEVSGALYGAWPPSQRGAELPMRGLTRTRRELLRNEDPDERAQRSAPIDQLPAVEQQAVAPTVQAIRAAIDALPAAHVAATLTGSLAQGFIVNTREVARDTAFARYYARQRFAEVYPAAIALARQRAERAAPGLTTQAMTTLAVAHEFGHALDQTSQRALSHAFWRASGEAVTLYSEESPNEAFAEAYAMYASERGRSYMRRRFPRAHSFMETLFEARDLGEVVTILDRRAQAAPVPAAA